MGWSVHEVHYQFAHSFYAWRHYGDKQVFTLWVSQTAAEDYEPKTILHVLKDFEPQALMNDYRHVQLHVTSNDDEFGAYARTTFSPTAA